MNPNIEKAFHDYEALIAKENKPAAFYNGIYTRYENPVLTRDHIPPFWRFDLNEETNPLGLERLGVNAVMNSGAIKLNGQYCLVARVEGNDRKSFFAVARSNNPVQGFRFDDYPVILPDTSPEETNVYDMRLTQHEDGYIYGVFCSESKDKTVNDLSAAFAAAGIVRTKDLVNWERLPDLKTKSPQQRNCVLHPEFVNGKYAFYTRPQDSFIEAGDQGGVSFGLCDDITNAVIDEEKVVSPRRYHTITESKNGAGAVPIKTEKGWIHLAHGVRNTAAGLRYVLYVFVTDLQDQTAAHRRPPRCPTRWPAVRSHIHSAGRGCAGPDIPHSMQPAAKMPPTPRPAPPADAAPCGPSGFFLPYRPLSIILSTKIPVRYGRHTAAPPVPRHPARPRRPCGGTRSAAAWRSCGRPA